MSGLRAAAARAGRWLSAQFLAPVVWVNGSPRGICSSALSRPSVLLTPDPAAMAGARAGTGVLAAQIFPWCQQPVRTKTRGTEYQPKTIKRIRTHGWKKRISTRGGIEVILRRMLKGRKSLTH
uniref:large ribosomal subunit protein bL34m n=1 Tax=Pristiophorus japonicus TaxID=55135 RepID=UPI00398E5B38